MKVAIKKNKERLEYLEGIIEEGLKSSHTALVEIRDRRLYRDVLGYETFEKYCKERWGMGRRYANRLIASSQVMENLGPMGPILPSSERQVRPLVALPADQQREVWQEAVKTAPEGRVTAAHVKKTMDNCMQKNQGKEVINIKKESINLSNLKDCWNASNEADRWRFVKWQEEYFPKHFKKETMK